MWPSLNIRIFWIFFLSKNLFYSLSRSAASPSMLRKFSSPIVANEGTPTTANKNYVKLITKRVSKVTTQLEAATGISRRSLGNPWLNVSNYNVTQIFEDKYTPIYKESQTISSKNYVLCPLYPKVQVLWRVHKNLKNLQTCFDVTV